MQTYTATIQLDEKMDYIEMIERIQKAFHVEGRYHLVDVHEGDLVEELNLLEEYTNGHNAEN